MVRFKLRIASYFRQTLSLVDFQTALTSSKLKESPVYIVYIRGNFELF